MDAAAQIAFWEARAAASDGYLDALGLADALLSAARLNGDYAALERAAHVLASVANRVPAGNPGLPLRLGLVALARHDFVGAQAHAERVLEIDPGHDGGLALLGDAVLELGDVVAAADVYRRLADEERSAPALARLARVAWLTGDGDRAEALLREAIPVAGDGTSFYRLQLAELLRGRNEFDEAAALYETVLTAQPGDVVATVGLAGIEDATGQRSAAIDRLEAALSARGPDPDILVVLGDLRAIDGDTTAAEAAWAEAELLERAEFERFGLHGRHLVAFLADHDRSSDEAVTLARAEVAAREDVHGWDLLAWSLYRAGRFAEADAAARQALRRGTPDAGFLYHAGRIAEALGRTDDARDLFAAALIRAGGLPPLQRADLAAAAARVGAD